MFALTPEDLRGRILDCGAGPASFNAEATGAGHQVISCDPLYRFSADAIRRRVEETADALSLEFHLSAVEEMARVAGEVRVFPLLGAYGAPSPHLRPLVGALQERGYAVELTRVPYEFLRGGHEVLSVSGS